MVRIASYIAALGRYNLFRLRHLIHSVGGILNHSDIDSVYFGLPHNDESNRRNWILLHKNVENVNYPQKVMEFLDNNIYWDRLKKTHLPDIRYLERIGQDQ